VTLGLGEARRHELDKFRERVAVVEAEIPLDVVERKKLFRLACYGLRNNPFGSSYCASGGSAA
jgi:hypothetical protein